MMDNRSNTNNMARYRNNYKVQKGELKRNCYFRVCDYCKSISVRCACKQANTVASPSVNRLFDTVLPNQHIIRVRPMSQAPASNLNETSIAEEHQ